MYVLDADVFIQAKRLHYGMDFAPGFWRWLESEAEGDVVRSIESVYDEIADHGDDLAEWVRGPGRPMFLDVDEDVVARTRDVAAWVAAHPAKPFKKNAFLSGADPFVVATGLARGWTVVTQEVSAGNKGDLKIPDACKALGVSCVNTFALMRARGVRLVLSPAGGGGTVDVDGQGSGPRIRPVVGDQLREEGDLLVTPRTGARIDDMVVSDLIDAERYGG